LVDKNSDSKYRNAFFQRNQMLEGKEIQIVNRATKVCWGNAFALRELQNVAIRLNHPLSGKCIKHVMTEVFLTRFPNGTDLYGGNLSSRKRIYKTSACELDCAFKEWIKLETFEGIKKYFQHVIHKENHGEKSVILNPVQENNIDSARIFNDNEMNLHKLLISIRII
jgi:hypothetical protein